MRFVLFQFLSSLEVMNCKQSSRWTNDLGRGKTNKCRGSTIYGSQFDGLDKGSVFTEAQQDMACTATVTSSSHLQRHNQQLQSQPAEEGNRCLGTREAAELHDSGTASPCANQTQLARLSCR
jgi:hypothetical protein